MEPLAQHDQQLIDQFELVLGFVGVVAGDIVKDGRELARDDVGQEFGGAALERQHIRAAGVDGGERSGQALGQQQVVETIGQCHRCP
jgi:hypothetical protein